jgi:hypothetical protein
MPGCPPGGFDLTLTVGPATGNFGVGVDWYGGLANLSTTNFRYYLAFIPSWEILGLLGLYPAVVLVSSIARRVRRHRRRLRGLCAQCGYNLTGNVSGTCPECGQGVEGKSF